VIAVGAWLVPWVPCGRLGGVAGPLTPVWLPWGRGRSPGPRVAAVGAWPVLQAQCGRRGGVAGHLVPVWPPWGVAGPVGPVWQPWGRDWSPGPLVTAVRARSAAWAPCDRRGGVAGPWAPCGRSGGVAGALGPVWPPWGVGGPLGPVWPPWGRGRFTDPRVIAVGAWLVPWAPRGRLAGVTGPLGP